MKKSVIFVALISIAFFSSCKNAEEKPEETIDTSMETAIEEQIDSVATDSIMTGEVAPVGIEKDTLTKK